jgi:phosphinothricin acetyltransferase
MTPEPRAYRIRSGTTADAEGVQAIYAPIVSTTVISFEYEAPTVAEVSERIERTLDRLPWLVADNEGNVAGYAYAAPHRERAAYAWSVDTSVYVTADWRKQGVGRALYTDLFAALTELGYVSAYAGITLPNAASVALHESCGYQRIGTFPAVGYKFGLWHDVGWWHRPLRPLPTQPEPLIPYTRR